MPDRPPMVGVLLAAGRGRRMGTTKQLMPWPPGGGASTVVAESFDLIAAECDQMIIVAGHDADGVLQALDDRPCDVVHTDPDAEMIVSARVGLEAAIRIAPTGVLLHLADMPAVAARTAHHLMEEFSKENAWVILPEYQGKGGHPVVMNAGMIETVLQDDGEGGLRAVWERHSDAVKRLSVNDPGVVADLDTPDDVDRIAALWWSNRDTGT